jgi:hypothetical protein
MAVTVTISICYAVHAYWFEKSIALPLLLHVDFKCLKQSIAAMIATSLEKWRL